MTPVRDFVADLARAGKGFLEIKHTVDLVFGDKALKKTAIYAILKKVKSGKQQRTSAISIQRKQSGLPASSPLSPPPLRMIVVWE